MYSLIPVVLITGVDFRLIVYIKKQKNKINNINFINVLKRDEFKSMKITVFTLTITFFITSTTGCFLFVYSNYADKSVYGPEFVEVIILLSTVSMIFHSCNFLILVSTNKKFNNEIKKIVFQIALCKLKPVSENETTPTQRSTTK